jgi:hypothetical protein
MRTFLRNRRCATQGRGCASSPRAQPRFLCYTYNTSCARHNPSVQVGRWREPGDHRPAQNRRSLWPIFLLGGAKGRSVVGPSSPPSGGARHPPSLFSPRQSASTTVQPVWFAQLLRLGYTFSGCDTLTTPACRWVGDGSRVCFLERLGPGGYKTAAVFGCLSALPGQRERPVRCGIVIHYPAGHNTRC